MRDHHSDLIHDESVEVIDKDLLIRVINVRSVSIDLGVRRCPVRIDPSTKKIG